MATLPLTYQATATKLAIDPEIQPTTEPTTEPTRAQPGIVIDQHRVLVANSQATDAGIKPGMSLATAQALCSQVSIFERDCRQESLALQNLAYSCYRFTPTVTPGPLDHVLLEIGGCLKLFKGLPRLLELIDQSITDQGHQYSPGLATTPKAAILFSRAAIDPQDFIHLSNDELASPRRLHALPLGLLDCPNKLKDKFLSTGFIKLGDLLQLPGPALGRRYGKAFLTYLKQLTGEQPDPQINLELPPYFESTLDFNNGITSTDMLAFPVKRLLTALSGYLYGRQLHCNQIRWRMKLSPAGLSSKNDLDNNSTEIVLPFAQPHNNFKHFLSMTRLQLDKLALRAPVESLTLYAEQLTVAEQKNIDLFGPQAGGSHLEASHLDNNYLDSNHHHANDDKLTMVLDKLRIRLGEHSVYCLDLADSHIPEQAWKTAALIMKRKSIKKNGKRSNIKSATNHATATTSTTENKPPIRPLWLLENPAPLQTPRDKYLYWHGRLELLQGPERIEGNWWQQAISRDYFVAHHHNGALYWLYRDRLDKRWFIHGLFG